MKLNLGCGYKKQPGFVNVDLSGECSPDVVWDLEKTPWPWESDSVDAVTFIHSLEHLGADHRVFKEMMRELYRVCCNGAEVLIKVPHPRHDDFITDPTHVRPITPGTMSLMSKRLNQEWIKMGAANTPLALYWGVDFDIKKVEFLLDEPYSTERSSGMLSSERLALLSRERNNVVKEITLSITVVK